MIETRRPPEYGDATLTDGNQAVVSRNEKSTSGRRLCSTETRSSSETSCYDGEGSVCYPSAAAVPPTASLLLTSRQLRAEMQETIRQTLVRYQIRLAYRQDKGLVYPTWVSMPAFIDHVDILDVEIRTRHERTASIFSLRHQ